MFFSHYSLSKKFQILEALDAYKVSLLRPLYFLQMTIHLDVTIIDFILNIYALLI
jgi:hypothetical protein